MLIAQISDFHLKPEGTLLYGVLDAFAHAEALVDRLIALTPRPDAVIVTGDITNDGTDADYAAAIGLLARLPMPVYPIIGNHDRREPARRALHRLCPMPPTGPLCYTAEIGELRLVALDSLIEGEPGGRVGPAQLEWLDRQLAAHPHTPTLVLVHHPPFKSGIEFMDACGLADGAELEPIIARHAHVLRVLCGHIHRLVQASFGGTIAMTAPGAAHQVVLDLSLDANAGWVAEPTGFLLHRWDGSHLVTHLGYTENYGPRHGFNDDHAKRA